MKKYCSYPLSFLFYFCFGSILVLFHGIQWMALTAFGYGAHKKSVDILNYFILRCLALLGTRITFEYEMPLPNQGSVIFVANHQSTYDIPPLIWELRGYHAKFVSKKELGKGIPSVSFNLRHGGSVLIDRKKPKEALERIESFGARLSAKDHSVIIFPEGTRSRKGEMKKFHRSGLIALFKSMPQAKVVPISIKNSWKFAAQNYFPMPIANRVFFKFHSPLSIDVSSYDDLIMHIETTIRKEVEY
jgi:1-acyl-sn-glycerol-3-phosphate acyltransferase